MAVRAPQLRVLRLAALLLCCGALYVAGIDYGRPLPEFTPATTQNGWLNGATIFHPDAYDYASRPYAMLLRGISPVQPNFYHNPSLTINLNLFFSWVTGAAAHYRGPYDPRAPLPEGTVLDCESGRPPHPICLREITPFPVYVAARYLSTLACLLAVAVIYQTGRRLWGARAGIIAAGLAAFCPLITQTAHYETPGAATFLLSSAALGLGLALIKKTPAAPLIHGLAGLATGLAAAARYNAVVVGVVTALAVGRSAWKNRRLSLFIIGLAAIPLGFVLGTPGAVFESRVFLEDVQYILFWYGSLGGGPGWTTANALHAMTTYWRYLALIVFGPVALLLALAALWRLLRAPEATQRWIGWTLSLYLVVYTLMALSSKRLNANLLIPMIAPVALLAAHGVGAVQAKLGRSTLPALMLRVALFIWPVFLSLYLAWMLRTTDTRLQAQRWLFEQVPPGTPIHLLGSYNVPVDPLVYPTGQTYGPSAAADDPLWQTPIIVYSDAYPRVVLRDLSLTPDPADIALTRLTADRLETSWIKLAHFPRIPWPGQAVPPDDVSMWHQMGITIYCNPDSCPVQP